MEHFLLFITVLTVITYISLFWASATSTSSHEENTDPNSPQAKTPSIVSPKQRKSDSNAVSDNDAATQAASKYYILGVG